MSWNVPRRLTGTRAVLSPRPWTISVRPHDDSWLYLSADTRRTDAGFDLPSPNKTNHAKEADAAASTEPNTENRGSGSGAIELNQEIDQVVKSLGGVGTSLSSFWGTVRKQVSLL